jgi:hypothetical protein
MSNGEPESGGVDMAAGRRKRRVPVPDNPDFLVSMPRLCAELDLPLKWVRRHAVAGELPSVKVGQRLLFNVDAVKKLLRERATRENQFGDPVS